MSSYKNNKDGTLTPIATNNHISQGLPQEGFVTEGELVEAVDEAKDYTDEKINDVWKAQGQLGAKNLIPFPYNDTHKEYTGITYDAQDDGSILINGTSTSYSFFLIQRAANLLPHGDYIISFNRGDVPANANLSLSIGITRKTNYQYTTKAYVDKTLDGKQFTIDETWDDYFIEIRISINSSGISFEDFAMCPMIRLASDTDSTWQPYAPTNYKLMQSDNALAEGLAKFGKRLWQGNFTSGSIEVAGAAKYKVILVYLTDNVLTIGNHYSGGGSYGSSGDYGMVQAGYQLSPTSSGDNMIYNITETAKGGRRNGAQAAIIAIYGLF